MNTTPKYYVCTHCGNIVEKLHDSGVKVVCCGEAMQELVPNTKDAALEKHVPAYTVEGNTIQVQVGSVLHPMLEEHYIGWIWLQTEKGGQRKALAPGAEPKATFVLPEGDKAVAIFEWCNLHGLWKVDV
ncbi:MAG: desulfoferrodoxin family protein [Oscillospiraceae bacterium]